GSAASRPSLSFRPKPGVSSAAAVQHRAHAEHETDCSGADDQRLFVLVDLPAPVGQLVDAAAERFDRSTELAALQVDVATDLRRRAAWCADRGGLYRSWIDAHFASFSSISLVSFASSIACWGTGGAP